MEIQTIQNAMIEALRDVQELCEEEFSDPISPSTCPFNDLKNFDSLRACFYVCLLEEKLGIEEFPNCDPLLFQNRPLSIEESASLLLEILQNES